MADLRREYWPVLTTERVVRRYI